jgi:serine/threonine protein phosphatase PrpC
MIDEEHILRILQQEEDPERCAARLVREANLAGGMDNISTLVIRIHEND